MERKESQNVENAAQEKHHPEYEILLKLLKEHEKKKNSYVDIEREEDIGSGKDCEPERKSSRAALQNPAPDVEKHQGNDQEVGSGEDIPVGKPNNVAEKGEMEKFPPTELTNDQKDGKSKTESCKAGESKNGVAKKTGGEDEKGVFRKRTSNEFRNAVMEDSMNEEERVVTRRRSARVSRKAIIEASTDEDERVVTKKRPTCGSRKAIIEASTDERVVIKKRSTRRSRKAIIETSTDEHERVATRRHLARGSGKAIIEISTDEDAEVEIEKGLPRNKESAHEDVRVETKKPSSLDSRNAFIEISKDADEERKVGKCSSYNKNVMKKSRNFEGGRMENKKRFTSDSRKSAGYEAGGREFRNVKVSNMNLKGSDHKGPSVKVRDVGGSSRVTPTDSKAEFRRCVLEIISKPYDKIEYMIIKEEFDSKNYTDYHPGLGTELVKNIHNRRKRLALMRGFYFYIQNTTREGAFKPWRDDICLAVEPQPLSRGNRNKSGK